MLPNRFAIPDPPQKLEEHHQPAEWCDRPLRLAQDHLLRVRNQPHAGDIRILQNLIHTLQLLEQIADIEKGRKKPVLSVGNLEAQRDFTDVRDMVRAYVLALEKCEPGEVYNICSGKAWTIQKVLDYLLGLTTARIEVKQDPARLRPSDVPILLGDNSKFVKATGWAPTIPFEQTLKDMLEYWRSR